MKDEQGLSEVIGFLMIVALLGILFSMYLLYVVPIQGKDAEITHMKYVSQQFIDLKSDIDSLIINERVNVPIARSFELGTLASTGQGSLSILPIQGFIEAAGTLVVNQQMDFLTIQGEFLTGEKPLVVNTFNSPPTNSDIPAMWIDNEHLYVNYPGIISINNTISGNISYINVTHSIINNLTHTNLTEKPYGYFFIRPETKYVLNKTYDFSLTPYEDPYHVNPDNSTKYDENIIWWKINTTGTGTPNSTDYLTYKPVTNIIFEFYNSSQINPQSQLQYQRTLQENATSRPHIFDLSKINEIISTDPNLLKYSISGGFSGGYGEPDWRHIEQPPQPLGSLQYWSQNRYWINQELLYEMGGLFLKQSEGVSIMLIPSLSVTPVDTTEGTTIKVSLIDVSITDTNDVSGSKSAQIFAKVDAITKNQMFEDGGGGGLSTHLLVDKQPNARYIIITFQPQNPDDDTTTRLWKRAFDQVYVITQKTMSERQVGYDIGNAIVTLYDPGPPRSASLLIGDNIKTRLAGVSGTNLQEYIDRLEATSHLMQPIFFDYTKARVSLVIQSGAL